MKHLSLCTLWEQPVQPSAPRVAELVKDRLRGFRSLAHRLRRGRPGSELNRWK